MSNEIAIIKQENIAAIVQSAPQSFADNQLSHERCLSVGKSLLESIRMGGMTDELDRQAASYIEKARRTVTCMNERRSPVTKLFDEIRKQYTTLEAGIDPTKTGTIPYQIQQLRNEYAARKREEEERRQREAIERQRIEQARQRWTSAVEEDIKAKFQAYVSGRINNIVADYESISLENYETVYSKIKDLITGLPSTVFETLRTSLVPQQYGIPTKDAFDIEAQVKHALAPKFAEQYRYEIETNRDYYLDRMPSRRRELEQLAKANAEEAARLKAEMEQRQAAEAARVAEERRQKEEEERRQVELRKQQEQMQSLFDGQAAVQEYQPKTKVTKRINLLNPEGILPVISMWWTMEGCKLTTEELAKMFKKQITFCERMANKEGELIQNESVEYIEDVKAK